MKVFMTGANGFVGTNLSRTLTSEGIQVTALIRNESKKGNLPAEVSIAVGDPTRPGKWQEAVQDHDVIINLAGATMFRRWTRAYKRLIRESRILTTRNLVDALGSHGSATLLSTSGVGYYGFTGDEVLDETSAAGSDFLATLAQDWEAEAFAAREKGARVVATRFGVVLGSDGGALAQMVLPFRFFIGGPLGNGNQWFSWIHVQDLCRAALFVASNTGIEGPVNFTAPDPVRNRDLAKAIGQVLHRPAIMPAPAFMINALLGEFGSVILKGQRVVPKKLLEAGFSFEHPDITAALESLLKG
ncbi:MAG: TIGR01777 family oxidoreductase [Deltaproteobacteria bacterium]|nr:TIGR01777 family oxidoreductase [Deltaproteobacteria bacterium]